MYKSAKIGKNKYVGLAQTFKGWNVSTFTVNRNRVRKIESVNTRTLANAMKEFTRQKRRHTR